jgi:hypothetical protein
MRRERYFEIRGLQGKIADARFGIPNIEQTAGLPAFDY